MSTEADIVERLTRRAATRNTGMLVSKQDCGTLGYYGPGDTSLDNDAAAEITKLRAERDAAGRDMQERAAMAVRNRICTISWPPEDGDELIDELMAVVCALPTSVIATERGGK